MIAALMKSWPEVVLSPFAARWSLTR